MLLLELHALTLVARSYALLHVWSYLPSKGMKKFPSEIQHFQQCRGHVFALKCPPQDGFSP